MSPIPPVVDDSEPLHRALDPRAGAIRDGKVHYMAFYGSDWPWDISVDRAEYWALQRTLDAWPGCGVGRLTTAHVRSLPFTPPPDVVQHTEGSHEAHAHISIDQSTSRNRVKTKICAKLAEITELICPPPAPTQPAETEKLEAGNGPPTLRAKASEES